MASEDVGKRPVAAWLSAFGAEPTRGSMSVVDLPPGTRLRRSVSGLAACWGVAAVAVFLPVLHLVLVPTLLGAGIVAAIVLGRQTERVTELRGTCPRCLTVQQFDAGGAVRRTKIITCPHCHTNVTMLAGEAPPIRA